MVGTGIVKRVEIGGTGADVGAAAGVIVGAPHPVTNNMRNARPIIGNKFLLSILISII